MIVIFPILLIWLAIGAVTAFVAYLNMGFGKKYFSPKWLIPLGPIGTAFWWIKL